METVTSTTTLEEFFSDRIQANLRERKLSLSPEAEYYIVQLLSRFAEPQLLFADAESSGNRVKPLALMLHDAVFDSDRRFYHLKRLGDTALYHAGVFFDALLCGKIDLSYYITMGQNAYHSLADLSTHRKTPLADIFDELGKQFAVLVEVVSRTCSPETAASDQDVLRLLELYLKTGSRAAHEVLAKMGIDAKSLAVSKTLQ